MNSCSIKVQLDWAIRQLNGSSTPQLDAQLLMMHVLQCTRVYLFTQDQTNLSQQQLSSFKALVMRRMHCEPIAYLLGIKQFWSLDLIVTPQTLIPRPETELLVALCLEKLPETSIRVADLGTGCGAIAIALAIMRPNWHIVATDISQDALIVAQKNSQRFNLNRLEFRQGDWCQALQGEKFHAIVSNPPYVASQDYEHTPQLQHEPRSALVSDPSDAQLKRIIQQANKHLLHNGYLLLEHGYDQAAAVRKYFMECRYSALEQHDDIAHTTRVQSAKWN